MIHGRPFWPLVMLCEEDMERIRVLFVCMGNICRSPMAEAVFRSLVVQHGLSDAFEIDSAGTGDWHVGHPPHRGTLAVLRNQGIDASAQRARQILASDLDDFDYVVAMDAANVADIALLREAAPGRVRRLLDFAPQRSERDVPDPYYDNTFDRAYELVAEGCAGLLQHIRAEHGL